MIIPEKKDGQSIAISITLKLILITIHYKTTIIRLSGTAAENTEIRS